MENVLSAKDVSKCYDSGDNHVDALKQTQLDVHKGEIIVIFGKSGSGKSTLLHVMGGLCKPESGEVFIKDQSLYKLSESGRARIRNQEIGFIFQAFNLVEELNALDNIRLPFDIAGRGYNIEYERELSDMLEISGRLSFYPDQLSGGEQQRIAIARALCMKPGLILADEPTGNLDAESGRKFMSFVKRTNEAFRQTYVIVTHDPEWFCIADRMFCMRDGFLKEEVSFCEK